MTSPLEQCRDAAQAARDLLADMPIPDGYYSASNEVIGLLDAALAAAEAALAAQGEPYGYLITNNVPESSPYRHAFYLPDQIGSAYKDNALTVTPLYAAPVAAPVAQPLTDEQITNIVREAARGSAIRRDGSTSHRIARAIEAAHGLAPKEPA